MKTKFSALSSLSLLATIFAVGAAGQSLTTGDIVGTILDLSGAVIPNAKVTLRNNEKGFTQASLSDAQGFYRFAFLPPGSYTEAVSASGFVTAKQDAVVVVGQTTPVDLILRVGSGHTTIEVISEAPLVQSQSADISTTFNAKQISNLPNLGNDLTYTVQTAPGAVMNTQGGTGNFSTFGLPANSNSFNLDGMNDNDPSLLVNNSGATNLLLGNNEVEEVTIVNNGYSGQYGGFAGASVNYVTKSGSNDLHGNVQYWWNGRVLNANNWFNKDVPAGTPATPRPFVNSNQYAASLGGPIRKNRIFFFVDYEGLRFVLPVNNLVLIPGREFEAATLTNLESTGHHVSVPLYNQMFSLWNGAPGSDRALPGNPQTADPTGCNGFIGPGGLGTTVPCALSFRSTADNFTREYLLGARFDFNLGQNDKLFFRLHEDQGLQATYTDPITPVFNLQSNDPIYQGQISETHIFNARAVNVLVFSSFYGSFIFQQKDLAAARAAFPTTLLLGDGSFSAMGARNVISRIGSKLTRYQVMDDLSLVRGNHSLKFGFNFNRFDLSAYNSGFNQTGTLVPFTLADFFAGGNGPVGDLLQQNFPSIGAKPLALYWLGLYGQDEWRANRNLTLTFSLRVDHNSNPVCQVNCFARFTADFDRLNHDVNTPYDQAIRIGLHQALPSFTNLGWQPRLGFAWAPLGRKNTVFSGGFGLFMDAFPSAIISGDVSSNPPLLNSFTTFNNNLSHAEPSNLFKDAASSNAAFVSGFLNGGTLASISGAASFFVPPSFTNTVPTNAPRYQEWNLKMQQGFGTNTSLTMNYVGNHGIHIPVFFGGGNAFCPLVNPSGPACPSGFVGLPTSAPDPRFGAVQELRSVGVSNYNGLAISFQRRSKQGLQLDANYTWSHALDEVSNGGIWSFNPMSTLLSPQGNNLRIYSYGNADYDTRHYFSADFIWAVPHEFGPEALLKGWQVAGTIFRRSGFPYTVVDSISGGILGQFSYAGAVYANFLGGSALSCSNPKHACLEENQFSSPIAQVPAGFGRQRRNQFYGPGFFNADLSIIKNTSIPGWKKLSSDLAHNSLTCSTIRISTSQTQTSRIRADSVLSLEL